MGVVYQAWDQSLDVPVALKVIRPEALSDPDAAEEVERRFKRELLLARQVTHRNVVRIHDIGELDGIKYISMPFIEGRDLASVLAESGRMSVKATLDIIRQVAGGLAAAHDAGVVHRDLKPENVMIDAEGRPVIMDFGISRTVSSGGTTLGLTTAGAVVGTLEYMAPEQALAQPVDQRADIYALGLIAYDMLAGTHRLASATTPISEMMQRLQQAPPPLRTRVAEIPEAVERMVARALEPDPAKRYQHIREWVADIDAFERGSSATTGPAARRQVPLRVVAALIAVVMIAAAAVWYARPREAAAVVQRQPVSVLIADFENRTGEDLFDGSLEQALGIGLEGASFVTTFPRREALRAASEFRPGAKLDRDVASLVSRREGIKYLLTGDISREDGGYRISVRAVDPISLTSSAPREARAANKTEVLAAMNELANGIRTDLGDSPTESSRAAARETFTAGTLQAAAFYSKAQDLAYAGKDEEAIELYKKAVAADQDFGRAYSGWANVAFRLGRLQEANDIYQTKAIPLTARMTDREKYRTLGSYYLQIKGDYAKAIENYSLVVKSYPADGAAHNNLAIAYFNVRDFDKALEEGKRLIDIYPKVVLYRYNYALYAMYAGRFDIAEAEARHALALNPQTAKAYLALAMSALARGDHAAAVKAYEDAAAKAGTRGESLRFAGLGDLAIAQGRFGDAITILRAGVAEDTKGRNAAGAAAKSIALAQALHASGRTGEALEAARAALSWSPAPNVAVPAAELLIEANHAPEALKLAQALGESLKPTERAAAKIIEGDAAVHRGRWRDAITAYRDALDLDDLWITRYKLGRAYVLAPQRDTGADALSELEAQCQRRQGEATAVFLDDVPSWRYSVELRYWIGRAYDKAGNPEKARALYEGYLKTRATAGDSLTADARARADAVATTGR
jgi:tetratricopeptide (TPR) repeat protein